MKYRLHSLLLAALLSLQLVPLNSAATDLTDVPMAVKNTVKPNIMFILDNSGSMDWRSITGKDATSQYTTSNVDFYSALVNQLYYDPETRYIPGIDKSSFSTSTPAGTPMANAVTSSAGALNDPYLAPTGTKTDLTKSCYYTGATAPLAPTGGTTSGTCRNYALGTYDQGPIAFTAYYYQYTGALPAPIGVHNVALAPATIALYSRRDILPATASYTRGANRTDCSVSGSVATCTYAQEIQNFANWFSYYRTRILTMKTTMGLSFAGLTDKYRLGFSTINNTASTGNSTGQHFKAMADFTDAIKIAWFTELYSIDPNNGTPLQAALRRVGRYYSGLGMGYSTAGVGTDDPVQFSCQHNYAILSTDGFWNSNTVTLGNTDLTVPTLPVTALDPVPATGLTAGATWPRPFYEGPTAASNTVADVATYYWVTDLRTSGGLSTNNVPVNSSDPASWQHMTTFTIGLGADGSKDYIEDYLTATTGFYANVKAGTDNWPVPVADTNTAIDDLWHAAVNGHGQYFSAKNPTKLRTGLQKVLDDIVARSGSAAAVAVANANVSSGDNAAYASSYNSGTWTGNLDAYALDLNTGEQSTTSLWTSGNAQTQLDLRTPAVTDRFIVSYSGTGFASSGVQFQSSSATLSATIASKLSTAQETRLNTPTQTDGATVLAYLRGDRTNEAATASPVYRTRAHLLGDIINAEPVVIRAPARRYFDSGYAAFKIAQKDRTKMVVQGANDGMVHVFNATTGAENWAYVPNLLIQMDDPTNSGTSVLNMLSRQTYAHRMFVDATPYAGDVDFGNTDGASATTPDWRTLLVGGLGKGGRGVYALDMTNPSVSGESGAAANVLWEFPNATTDATVKANTGYVFGRPLIVKTKAKGWVVLVASGYNNGTGTDNSGGDGHGYLFVLNARTGELISAIDTTVGSTATPSGISHLSAFVVDADYNNTVSHVYGGDLLGNVWRFDLSHLTDYTQWGVKRLAIVKDGSSGGANTQPVTTEPRLATVNIGGAYKRFVYVATGRYLGDTDVPISASETLPGSQKQTIYALVDDLTNPSGIDPVIADNLRGSLQGQAFTRTATTATVTTTAVDYTTKKGWYIDLADTGTTPSERVNTNPALVSGALILTANTPSSDACLPGGSSWLYVLDYTTGGALTTSTTGLAGIKLGDALASRPVVILLPSGAIKVLVRTSDSKTLTPETGIPVKALKAPKRAATREILK